MTTDRELLELAAKTAGTELWQDVAGNYYLNPRLSKIWNPLTDDGDALRLAVKLNLDIEFLPEPDGVEVWVCATWDDTPVSQTEEVGKDPYAATRRAIVRAAAELGRAMK